MLNNFLKLMISILIPLSAGFIGSFFTMSAINTWYINLIKPALNPPSWVFGPVWTILYILMGIALFIIWKRGWDKKHIKVVIGVFGLQLLLNVSWSIIFFGLQSPGWAFVNIILLWLAIIWAMVMFYKINKLAMYLLVPYILWVSFALYLNLSIWLLN